jgi:hypothetical protein
MKPGLRNSKQAGVCRFCGAPRYIYTQRGWDGDVNCQIENSCDCKESNSPGSFGATKKQTRKERDASKAERSRRWHNWIDTVYHLNGYDKNPFSKFAKQQRIELLKKFEKRA